MNAFYIPAVIQFAAVLFLGLPLAVALAARDRHAPSLGWVLLSPALGTAGYLSLATILHSFGFRSAAVFWGLLGLAAAGMFFQLARARRPRPIFILGGIAICMVAAALAFAVNAADLVFAGLDYFPLTNDDTFSYLGHIDQIRAVGWNEPRIPYPAGFIPLIDHAVSTRTTGVILVADFADLLGLESHSSFFLTQRLALPVVALGASGVVMLVTCSWMASQLCFASLIFGNVLLHQILQQFNSSTLGTVIAPLIVAMAIWTFRPERSQRERWAGFALAGWLCGTLAITSTEAHAFYLIAFGAVALVSLLGERQWIMVFREALSFVALYMAASFPFVLKLWPALISQFVNAGTGHPGDWIAATGFLVQATGVTLTTADKLSAYPIVPRFAALAVFASMIIAIITLAWTARAANRDRTVVRSDLLALVAFALLLASFQAVLYTRGSGYGLLKVTDYFAFLGAIVVSVAAFQLGLTRRWFIGCVLAGSIGCYCAVAFVEKREILARYRDRTALLPLPASYRLPSAAEGTLVPDLSADVLNLFLYENRFGSTRITFGATESNRYRAVAGVAGPDRIARLFHAGALGTTVADISYPDGFSSPVVQTEPAIGQTHLVQPDPHWLGPTGLRIGLLWRWLSGSGGFIIYGPLSGGQRTLHVNLAAGPDMRPDNQVEIYVLGQRLLTVSPAEMPLRATIALPALAKSENDGEIRIVGPAGGIYQLSVGNLRSLAR
ncbi:hypothetical protein V1281_000301 [Nitrobacteraceae bacterium AZCC 2161]